MVKSGVPVPPEAATGAPRIYGTGLIALDLVVSANASRPVQAWAGGTCGNVLAILSFLGWDSYPIARMNYAPAAHRIELDLKRWGVSTELLHCTPMTEAPVIVQQNRIRPDGTPTHKFTWACPRCGNWLPGFRPITRAAVASIEESMNEPAVFFLDRVFPAALALAKVASAKGALIVFEPSGRSEPRLFAEALKVSHVVKYSEQRLSGIDDTMIRESSALLEIQTLGDSGLRFRTRATQKWHEWRKINAIRTERVVDTSGAGDWCTAGLLSQVASGGIEEFQRFNVKELRDGLRYGQTLAAWNCGFEGARGGMYESEAEHPKAPNAAPMTRTNVDSAREVCPACV